MSEGFVWLLKQITDWSFLGGARLLTTALQFVLFPKHPGSIAQV